MIDRERIKEILEDSLSEGRQTDFVPAQDEEMAELCRVYLAWLDAQQDKPSTGTVADISDENLLRRAVCHLAPRARKQPAWARISDVFALGSTYSAQLCRRFGRDPDTGKNIDDQ